MSAAARRTSRRTARIAAVTTAALIGLGGLTACLPGLGLADDGPFPGQSGSQVADRSTEALKGASSLTVTGTVRDKGKPIQLDMAVSKSGECRGTMAMPGEGSFELIRTAEHIYIKADEAFYRAQVKDMSKNEADAVLKQLVGKWVKSKASEQDSKEIAELCDLDQLLGTFQKTKGTSKGGVEQVDGEYAVKLTTRTKEGTETLYVATKGEPYLLKAVLTGQDPASVTFSKFNQPVQAQAPTSDVVDTDNMGQ
ncbi:hypothetical protein [Streptomyces bambusae]|uniref:Lipoprotein n=1 Tax=Streptomyces bambusae TaxID=1550616 RepID=A0ABS6ZFI0_9ACTN|nr:hypothetical protein [Streptomyces bambusae]MBW5485451.1 hypothetical protein [Streptomyces bambusae]